MAKVYTRTGDKGTTTLYNGTRVPKDDRVFDALGHIDELAAQLGVALCAIYDAKLPQTEVIAAELEELQQSLIRVGSCVATPLRSTRESRLKHRPVWTSEQVTRLEQCIDRMHGTLPPLRTFVLPGGWSDDREHVCYAAAYLHVCRVVCRRAERSIVPLWNDGDVEDVLMHFMNRLSDYLFTAARFVLNVFNEQVGGEERRNAGV